MFEAASTYTAHRVRVARGACIALVILSLACGTLIAQSAGAMMPAGQGAQVKPGGITGGTGDTEIRNPRGALRSRGRRRRSIGGGQDQGPQEANPEYCVVRAAPVEWQALTGEPSGDDWIGGMYCFKD